MIDSWIAPGREIRIGASNDGSRAPRVGDGYVIIDQADIQNSFYINSRGETVQDSLVVTLTHELSHVYHFPVTNDPPHPRTDAEKNKAAYDFQGSAIDFQNEVIRDLANDDPAYLTKVQVVYGSMSRANVDAGGFPIGESLTEGNAIDTFRKGDTLTDPVDNIINHSLRTTEVNDLIVGLTGTDTIHAGLGNDYVYGDYADPTIKSGWKDIIHGGLGNDVIYGGGGGDYLYGDEGTDRLYGGAGNDFLDGGSGVNNILDGGAGINRIISRGQGDIVRRGEEISNLDASTQSNPEDPQESQMFVRIGATTTVQDATTQDRLFYGETLLTGGVQAWWSQSGTATCAPFTSLIYAFPTVGAGLMAIGAVLADAPFMKLASYRIDQNGNVQILFGYGLAGIANVENYELDMSSGIGTAGLTIFRQGGGGRTASVDQGIGHYVNLALYAGFGAGMPGFDPLVLDIDGDGFELTAREYSQVYFDLEANGFAKQTGWVGADDALLARDVNGNGAIDSGAELFGNRSQSGFAALGALDTNSDGVINSSDSAFSSLRVWRDLNQDGVSQAEELQTLAEAGIDSLSLAATTAPAGTTVRNNSVASTAQFTRSDGTTGTMGDVTFDVSDLNTRWTGTGDQSAAALALPQVGGLGTMRDLRSSMTSDGVLLSMVNNLVGSAGVGIPALMTQVEDILWRWSGADSAPATPLGTGSLDTRKLAFLEKYTGLQLLPRDANGQISGGDFTAVEDLWNYEFPRLALRLLAQGPLSDTFAGLNYNAQLDQFVAGAPDTISVIINRILEDMPPGTADAQTYWNDWGVLIGALADTSLRSSGANVSPDFLFAQLVAAVDGANLPLTLTQMSVTLAIDGIHIGSQGALTRTSADQGTQIWFADQPNAVMTGGSGQDAYIFGNAIGQAVITDIEARESGDRIRFAFLESTDVTMGRDGNDLLITVIATGETVRVVGQFAPVTLLGSDNIISSNKGVEDIQFADGVIFEAPQIAIAVGRGSSGNDHLVGTMHTDVLQGLAGDDILEGGDDADIYYVGAGEGHDIVRDQQSTPSLRGMDMLIFGEGVAPEDLQFSRAGADFSDLLITIGGSENSVLIDGQFDYTSLGVDGAFALNSRIEAFAFRDIAETWTDREIQDLLIQQATTVNADITRGFGGSDTFQSSAGNDLLIGMDGADTYEWGLGSGNDAIDEDARFIDVSVGLGGISLTVRADTIVFGDGIDINNVVFASNLANPDLLISLTGSSDTLVVRNQFAGFQTGVLGAQWFDRVEWFEFSDGTRLSWQDVLAKVTTGGAGDDNLRGDLFVDRLDGGAGNDYLSGRGFGDTYVFNLGYGHDTIDDANDTILGNGFITLDGTPDILQLGAGITEADLTYQRNGSNIDIIVGSSGDRITLKGQDAYIQTGVFGAVSYTRIEQIRFDDGTVWSWATLNAKVLASLTTAGNDVVTGFTLEDRLEASAGDDILMGGESGDTYVFGIGSGDDIIREGVGNVLYGDHDVLEFAGGITSDQVTLTRVGNNLILGLGSGDTITIEGQFAYQAWYTWTDIELFRFANGDWTANDIRVELLKSTAGNDTIIGFASDDVLDGGAGNDILIGSDGADTYHFDLGQGNDVIRESVGNTNLSDFDRVVFGPNIEPGNLALSRVGDDLIFTVISSGETLTIEGHFSFSNWFAWQDVERFEFANAPAWTDLDVARMLTGGTGGDDHLIGTFRSDTLDGGAGNDLLEGGDGADIYYFGRGYGQDEIRESLSNANLSDNDELRFGPGVTLEDLQFTRNGSDLVITILGTTDSLQITDQFANSNRYLWHDIERFAFDDGTSIDRLQVQQFILRSTPGDDHLVGFVDGDTLDGGAGNDLLEGGDGADTYVFGRGYGNDRIIETMSNGNFSNHDVVVLAADISAADVTLTRSGNDLVITLNTGETLTVTSHFVEGQLQSTTFNDIEEIRFTDGSGTVWDKPAIAQRYLHPTAGNDDLIGTWDPQTINGLGGDDAILAGGAADTLIGGTGNDLLQGQGGDDTYIYSRGDGDDTIREAVFYDGGGVDRIVLGAGILASDVTVSQAGNGQDYLLTIAGGGSILLDQALSDGTQKIEYVEFSDGTVWTGNDLFARSSVGTAGNDTIFGDAADNLISGQGGDDTILGGWGGDTLAGNVGNDLLIGQGGNDVYVYNLGDGDDIVREASFYDGGGTDRVRLGAGILPADVTVTQVDGAQDYRLSFASGGSLILDQAIVDGSQKIEFVEFADGTVWTAEDLLARVTAGTSGDDSLSGDNNANVIFAGAGNDTIQARGGNDIIIGGTGNDTLQGQGGNDVYRFGVGDGQDVINEAVWYDGSGTDAVEFDAGVTPAMVTVTQVDNGASLLLSYGSGDSVKLLNTMSNGDYRIESVKFADGTIWNHAQLVQFSLADNAGANIFSGSYDSETIDAGAGNDTIQAGGGNDIVIGGTGNDTLQGQGGNDIYRFGVGDGQDVINEAVWYDGSGTDAVEFGTGVTPGMVTVTQVDNGASLLLSYGSGDSIKLLNTMSNGDYRIESVKFADGTIWSHADLVQFSLADNAGPNTFWGSYNAETIDAGAGNDTIDAGGGADILVGGTGNDTLTGSGQSDTYRFNLGDGQDIVRDNLYYVGSDTGSADTIEFGAGITPGMVTVTQIDNGESLLLTFGSGDSVKLAYSMNSWENRIEFVKFVDVPGTQWSHAQLLQMSLANNLGANNFWGSYDGETIDAGTGNDIVDARGGADILIGGIGNDTLSGSGQSDIYRFSLGDGQDVIDDNLYYVGSDTGAADTIELGAGITTGMVTVTQIDGSSSLLLTIGTGGDSIRIANTMTIGEDRIEFVKFADGTIWTHAQLVQLSLANNGGNNSFGGTFDAETIDGGAGNDIIDARGGADIIIGGAGNDTLSGSGQSDIYRFNLGDGQDVIDDNLYYVGSDTGAADAIEFGTGITTDMVTITLADGGNSLLLSIGSGGDSIRIASTMTNGSDRIEFVRFADGTQWTHADLVSRIAPFGPGPDSITGTSGADSLQGGAGNDTINALAGNDTLDGGGDNDVLDGGAGDDLVDGGTGIDTASFSSAASGVTVSLATALAQNTVGAGTDTLAGIENLAGSGFNDTLTGDGSANAISGAAGNDLIDGGAGDDTLDGGAGVDTLSYASASAGITAVLSIAAPQNTIGAGTDTVSGFENLTGSGFADSLTGDSIANAISGGAGNDLIEGGAGNDALNGGSEIDTVSYASAAAGVTVSLAITAAQNTVGAGSDTLTAFENLAGSAFNDALTGDASANSIGGAGGDDVITGGLGDDSLDGGAGIDTASYAAAAVGVVVNLAMTGAQNTIGAGIDTLTSFENLMGSAFNDTLSGDANSNLISGAAGIDVIDGGAGNDTLDGGAGIDTVSFASAAAAVTVSLATTTAQNTVGAGSDTLVAFENLTGSAFNDTLTGDANANVITGGIGNDMIEGAAGNDTLDGGGGVDTASYASAVSGVTVNLAATIAQNTAGAGTDTLTSIENLIGSAFNDTLDGDGNANTISGGSGDDTIQGGAGNDTLDGGAGIDILSYASAAAGVTANLSLTAAQNTVAAGTDTLAGFENVTGSGFADTLTGNTGANVISGGAGNDTIDGGAGDDILEGGAGDDTLTGNTGNDTATYASATAGVTVSLAITKVQNTIGAGTDKLATIENLTGSAFNDTLTGSSVANVIKGGAGNDVIDAGSGDDVLEGGDGNDTLTGNTGLDTASYASATGGVTVSLAIAGAQNTIGAGTDTITTMENLVGSAFADTLTGSTAANVITGGAGNDTINGGAGADVSKVAGLRASYTLVTGGGQVQLVDNDAVADGNDGTDTLIAIETIQFKDQSMGIVSPIILDLDGNGVQTVSAAQSRARFDMDGDGLIDDTSWIGSSDGFLFLDRDGNGTLSGIGEMSFTGDLPGATTDLAGLAAFDSNGDGFLSAGDSQFGDFFIWRDSDSDGKVDNGEVLTLSAIRLESISLTGTANNSTVNIGDVVVVNNGSWTRTDGTVMQLADAAMTFFSSANSTPDRVYNSAANSENAEIQPDGFSSTLIAGLLEGSGKHSQSIGGHSWWDWNSIDDTLMQHSQSFGIQKQRSDTDPGNGWVAETVHDISVLGVDATIRVELL